MKKIMNAAALIGVISVVAFCVWKVIPELKSGNNANKEKEIIQKLIKTEGDESFSKQSWQKLIQENEDFQGYLMFESGLIETPVVQGQDNEEYLYQSFEGLYDTQGIPFMDAQCSRYSTNITIYGHNVYYDKTAKFSPLERLTDEETFLGNRKVFFFLEDEVREYETVYVLYITSEEAEDFEYAQSSFTLNSKKQEWIDFIKHKSLWNREQDVSVFDNFLTLQTCRKWNENEHLLVVCKERDGYSY